MPQEIRYVTRVSEEHFQDGKTGLYYWFAPIYKKGSDAQIIADMKVMVERLADLRKQGEQVLRPTSFIQKSVMKKMSASTIKTLAENTYLMMFDYGAAQPTNIPDFSTGSKWAAEGNSIFLWSDDTRIYTWCNSNQIGHRYYRVPEGDAVDPEYVMIKPQGPPDPGPGEPPAPGYLLGNHIKGTITSKTPIGNIIHEVDLWLDQEEE